MIFYHFVTQTAIPLSKEMPLNDIDTFLDGLNGTYIMIIHFNDLLFQWFIKYVSSFTDIQNVSDNEIFSVLMSCNNDDYAFTKSACNFVNRSFEIRCDHLESVNQIM